MISLKKAICIPAYNEENTIAEIIKKSKSFSDLIVICDDGSDDKTSEIAKKEGATVLKHNSNLGKGAAMKTLFNYSKENNIEAMVTIDGDGQFLPEEIPTIIEPILKRKCDVVIGYRFDDDEEMPKYRKVGNKMLDKVTNLASDLPFRDTQGGFRAYSKNAIEKINFSTTGFGVDSEILVDASKKGLKVIEKKVTVIYDTGEKTSTKDPISHSTQVIVSLIELIAIHHPLKFLGIPGFVFVGIGIALAVNVISLFNEDRYFSIPLTLGSLGSFTTGLILILMSAVLFSISKAIHDKK